MKELSRENIQKILEFLKITDTGTTPKPLTIDEFYTNTEIIDFFTTLDTSGFTVIFDYNSWLVQNSITLNGENALMSDTTLTNCNLEDLRRLITSHIRIDRFITGHLCSLWNQGYFHTFLQTLAKLTA